jgi:uncharacterized protein YxeA
MDFIFILLIIILIIIGIGVFLYFYKNNRIENREGNSFLRSDSIIVLPSSSKSRERHKKQTEENFNNLSRADRMLLGLQ